MTLNKTQMELFIALYQADRYKWVVGAFESVFGIVAVLAR